MSVKIRLMRTGKIRTPYFRIVVSDSRKARNGLSIEEIGRYSPATEPSLIEVNSDRAQYWLGVGAQPTEAVEALLKITGDWQKAKGLPGAEGTLKKKAAEKLAAKANPVVAEPVSETPAVETPVAEASPEVEVVAEAPAEVVAETATEAAAE